MTEAEKLVERIALAMAEEHERQRKGLGSAVLSYKVGASEGYWNALASIAVTRLTAPAAVDVGARAEELLRQWRAQVYYAVEKVGEATIHALQASVEDKIFAALQPRRAEDEWRPIGKAPRDGTVFLAYLAGTGGWELASWNEDAFENIDGFECGSLTHFMPLPAPPRAEEG